MLCAAKNENEVNSEILKRLKGNIHGVFQQVQDIKAGLLNRDFNIAEPDISAKSALLFDTRSSKLLYQKDAFRQLPIASLTKLMTSLTMAGIGCRRPVP